MNLYPHGRDELDTKLDAVKKVKYQPKSSEKVELEAGLQSTFYNSKTQFNDLDSFKITGNKFTNFNFSLKNKIKDDPNLTPLDRKKHWHQMRTTYDR